jgi:hypothetical protein
MKIYTLNFYYPIGSSPWECERRELGVFDSREKAEQAQAIFEPLIPMLEEIDYDFENSCGFSIWETEVNVVQDDPDGLVHSTNLGYHSVAELRAGLEKIREERREYEEELRKEREAIKEFEGLKLVKTLVQVNQNREETANEEL